LKVKVSLISFYKSPIKVNFLKELFLEKNPIKLGWMLRKYRYCIQAKEIEDQLLDPMQVMSEL